ncbi:MAG: hypothetical protein ACLFQK_12165 [Fibrobacterota bacterium]
MKKTTIITIILTLLITASCGKKEEGAGGKSGMPEIKVEKENYKPGEKDALIVLKAYAEKDLETLKSYAGMIQQNVMDEDYFKTNENVINFREKISKSSGEFTDLRYYEEEKNFQNHYYLTAVFFESPSGQLTGVKLKSKDKNEWKLAGFGTTYIKKDKYAELSSEIPE